MSADERPFRVHVATERWDGDQWLGTCHTRHVIKARMSDAAVATARQAARDLCVEAHGDGPWRYSPVVEHWTAMPDNPIRSYQT